MPHRFYSVASRDGYKPAVCGCSSQGLNFWVRNNTKTLNPNKEVLLSEPFLLLLIVPVILLILIIYNYTLQLLKLECCLQIDLGEHKQQKEESQCQSFCLVLSDTKNEGEINPELMVTDRSFIRINSAASWNIPRSLSLSKSQGTRRNCAKNLNEQPPLHCKLLLPIVVVKADFSFTEWSMH